MSNNLIPFLLFFLLTLNYTSAQLSPGELTKAHADLEGMSNCTRCHVLGEQVNNSKCLTCHTEINILILNNEGYHASSEVKGKDCWSCHSEHHGRNFRIVNFNPDGFNHTKTGFNLTGAHKKVKCTECHQNKFIQNTEIKKRSGTYLGLITACISCHEDYHIGTLGQNCSNCHNTDSFKKASAFDHNKAAYKLTGLHTSVDCIKCHPFEQKNGENVQKFKGVAFNNCSSCHKDFHNGKFGPDCQSCHSTNSFHQINQSAFNHNKTDFPLVGKHNQVKCNNCHKINLTKRIEHEKCINCHSDYHKGEFTKNNVIRDCSECHNEFGFSPTLFTIQNHNNTKFNLTGSHLAVPCASCHSKNNEWHFKEVGLECIDCHNNVHGQEITTTIMGNNNCQACHISDNWSAIIFDHNKTRFTLLGKHIDVNCKSCHSGGKNIVEEFKFSSLGKNCTLCHKDSHYGQFNQDECEKCHGFNNWEPIKFDHNKTRFSLSGAHSKLQCQQCHKIKTENNFSFIQYKMTKTKCRDCHS